MSTSKDNDLLSIGLSSSAVVSENKQIAVSLGKPSLRVRLEAYYSLISPDIISVDTEWRIRFEQIWTKFGRSANCTGTTIGKTTAR